MVYSHLRFFYDLWDSSYRNFPDDAKHRGMRDVLHATDTAALQEAQHIFTNSQIVSDRVKKFNGLDSEVLYPPVFQSERFYCKGYNDEIVYVCRMEHHKRQHLLIQAMHHVKTACVSVSVGSALGSSTPQNCNNLSRNSVLEVA